MYMHVNAGAQRAAEDRLLPGAGFAGASEPPDGAGNQKGTSARTASPHNSRAISPDS